MMVWMTAAAGVIAAMLYMGLRTIPLKVFNTCLYTIAFAFAIYLFSYGMIWLRGYGHVAINELTETVAWVVKYGIACLAAALTLPHIAYLLYSIVYGGKKQ